MTPTLLAAAAATAATSSPFALHWSLYPKTYVAPRIPLGIRTIDGDLNKDVWSVAPWSDDFDDIRGSHDAPADDRPRPSCRTRVKMMWDDEYLYIGALLTSDMTVEAHFTERNSPIFQKDSDFEVFVDPNASCPNYKEFEMNALNTVWNLMLDRPYSDGGSEHSGRIAKPGDDMYYDVMKQKSATRILKGTVNNRDGETTTWSVEIAMAHSDLLAHITDSEGGSTVPPPPSIGTKWRINFSRVEKRGDINWTWQPQIAWDAPSHRFAGFVDMHRPDAWGYLVFGSSSSDNKATANHNEEEDLRDSTWPARLAAMNVYYAQQQFKQETGSYASRMDPLSSSRLVNEAIISPFQIEIQSGSSNRTSSSPSSFTDLNNQQPEFTIVVMGNPDGAVVTVTDKRLIQVHPTNKDTSSSS